MDVRSSSDGIINGALTNAWTVTLTSTNGSLKFVNFEPGSTFTLVVQEDASGSNYTLTFPANVIWSAGQAPNRNTAANAFSVYTFTFDGTNFRDASGAPAKLPSRIQSAALGTIVGVVLASAAVFTLVSSGGNGQRPGAASLPDIVQYKTGTGAQQVTVGRVNASGSLVLGQSGSLSIGSPLLSATGSQAKFYVDKTGKAIAKGALSGASITVNAPSAGIGQATCFKTTGQIGYCSTTPTNGTCTCN